MILGTEVKMKSLGTWFVLFLLLCLCVSSWGACYSGEFEDNNYNYYIAYDGWIIEAGKTKCVGNVTSQCGNVGCPSFRGGSGSWWTGAVVIQGDDTRYQTCGTGLCGQVFICRYTLRCDTQAEADSVACLQNPDLPQCSHCDSTAWTCETTNEMTQTTVASDNITCFGGECYGTTYCEMVSRTVTTCTNECGTSTSQEYSLPYRYDGACNQDYQVNPQCGKTKCIEPDNGHYALYQNCVSNEVYNGQVGTYSQFVGGGLGSCRSAGYPNEGSINSSSSGGVDSSQVSRECLLTGQNCPSDSGNVDFLNPQNRTAENGCSCEPGPSLWYTVCPDGSITADYGKCFYTPPSSSSESSPPSSGDTGTSSSSPEGGATSSPSLEGDWVNYSQGEQIKSALAAIYAKMGTGEGVTVNVASQLSENDIANAANSVLLQFSGDTGGVIPVWNFSDSSFGTLDTNGVLEGFFSRFDTTQNLVDTVAYQGSGTCPTFTFFRGQTTSNAFTGGHVRIPEMKFYFGDFHGFNLCTIIASVVKVFSSIVAFFIGWKFLRSMW